MMAAAGAFGVWVDCPAPAVIGDEGVDAATSTDKPPHDAGPRYNGQSDWSRVWAGSGSPVISCRRIRPTVLRGIRRACPICAWVMPWAR